MNLFKFILSEVLPDVESMSSSKVTACLSQVLNKFDPLMQRKSPSRPFAPWMKIAVKAQNQKGGRTGRLFRKTVLTVHPERREKKIPSIS